jgi:hypothetical protein
MREAQPHGTLPLFLSNVATNTEAEARQADRRVEGVEDALAKTIFEWFQTPVTRSEVEEELGGGFADLDSAHAGDKTLGLRTFCTAMQVTATRCVMPWAPWRMRGSFMQGVGLAFLLL